MPTDGGSGGDSDLLAVGQSVTLAVRNGSSVSGEIVAIYDHSLWWDAPSTEWTYGLFRPALLRPYPSDRSIATVSSLDLVGAAPAPATTGYRDALRSQGILIRSLPIEGAYVITGHESYHQEENGYGDFAWDVVQMDASGARWAGAGTANEDYLVWDEAVLLPSAGCVVEVVDEVADNIPGAYVPGSLNNLVGVHLFGSYYLYLLHFRQHSIDSGVVVGACLPQGTYLGRVGNAGASLEPHLHLTVLWYDAEAAPPRSWSVPSEWSSVYWADTPDGGRAYADFLVPTSGTWLFSAP